MLNNINDMLSFFAQQDDFNAAIKYTAGRFNFSARLIEKDYLCSLMLMYLFSMEVICHDFSRHHPLKTAA